MEVVGVEVGENPPASPPPFEVGRRIRANDGNGRPEEKPPSQGRAPLNEREAAVMQLWKRARRRAAETQEAEP